MKSFTEFIQESLIYEGGHSIDGAEPIRGDLAKQVADEIIEKIKSKKKQIKIDLGNIFSYHVMKR